MKRDPLHSRASRSSSPSRVLAAGSRPAPRPGRPRKAAAKDDVTLTLMYPNTVQNAWTKTIEDFEHKYPNIKINAQYVDEPHGQHAARDAAAGGQRARPLLGRRRHGLVDRDLERRPRRQAARPLEQPVGQADPAERHQVLQGGRQGLRLADGREHERRALQHRALQEAQADRPGQPQGRARAVQEDQGGREDPVRARLRGLERRRAR